MDVPLKSDSDVNATNVYAQLSRTNEAGYLYLTASVDVVLDSWSRPYLFRFDGDRDGQVTVGTHLVKERFAVWSAGPNGINELGARDDVICWPKKWEAGALESSIREARQAIPGSRVSP